LGKNWEDLVSEEGNREQQFFQIVERSRQDGWIDALIREARAMRPGNRYVAWLDVTLGLMTPNPPPEGAPPNPNLSLERMIASSEMKKFTDLVELQGRICRVEAGQCCGTGFLVGDDLVLTNYHVVEDCRNSDGRDVICRFDVYAEGKEEGRIACLTG